MAGFETLAEAPKENREAAAEERRREAEEGWREGIPTDMWRALQ